MGRVKKLKEIMLSKVLYISQAHLLPGMSLSKWEEIMKGRGEVGKMKLAELDEIIELIETISQNEYLTKSQK